MIPAAFALGGAIAVAIGLRVLPATFRRPPHLRENYRGRIVIGTAGIVLIAALAVGLSGGLGETVPAVMAAVGVAIAVLGFIDDVHGDRRAGGFAGHLRELVRGHVTTGLVKALGGGVAGLAAAWALGTRGAWIVVAGAVIALSANLANLLDLRPGRAVKVWLPCAVALLVAGVPARGDRVLAALAGGAIVFGAYELREKVMLGDTGAGLIGAVAGVAAAATLGHAGLAALAAVLVMVTLASEIVSFTRVIDAIPPLRWVDRLGRES